MKGSKEKTASDTLVTNRKARRDYHIIEKWEAGVALRGGEVKSLRAHDASLNESFARMEKGEVFLYGFHINPYPCAQHVAHDPVRPKRLLLHRREIDKLIGRVQRDGYTLVPTALYWKGNKVKVEIALAKGKQAHDKRAANKERDWNREKQQVMRRHNKYA